MTNLTDQKADLLKRLDNLRNHGVRISEALEVAELREAEALADAAAIEDEDGRRKARKAADALNSDVGAWRTRREGNRRAIQLLETQLAELDRDRAAAEERERRSIALSGARQATARLFATAAAVDDAVDALGRAHRAFRDAAAAARGQVSPMIDASLRSELDQMFAPYVMLGLVRARLVAGGVQIAATVHDPDRPTPSVAAALGASPILAAFTTEPCLEELA